MIFQNSYKIGLFIVSLCLVTVIGCRDNSEENQLEKTKHSVENDLAFTSKDSIKAKGLISVEAAKMLLDTRIDLALFEVSKDEQYATGHIPGATQM